MQEELTILNICAPNTGAPRFIKQVFRYLKRDLDSYTIIVGDFTMRLSILNISMKQKTNKDIQNFELSSGSSGPKRHVPNSLPQINRIYILLSATWDLF